MSDVAVFVQARLGSSRFPRKSFVRVGERPIFVHTCLAGLSTGHPTYLLVPHSDHEEFLAMSLHEKLNVRVLSFPEIEENDVTTRFVAAALEVRPKFIVRLTADCPAVSAECIKIVVDTHMCHPSFDEVLTTNVHYDSSVSRTPTPDGFDVEVFSTSLLFDSASKMSSRDLRREHVTGEMRSRDHSTNIVWMPIFRPDGVPLSGKFSLDTLDDAIRLTSMWDMLRQCRPKTMD